MAVNQIIKEECPYCEQYVTATMRDTIARKATRWVAKKGVTSGLENGVNAICSGAPVGTVASKGLKYIFPNVLDKAGDYAESKVFEVGDFDFSCPHCGHRWMRQIQHSHGDITIQIDNEYVAEYREKDIAGRFRLFLLSLCIMAVNLFLLFLCYNWCSGVVESTRGHFDGFFGQGAYDYETGNPLYYFGWFLFGLGVLSNAFTIRYMTSEFQNWQTIKNMKYEKYRFNLLTEQDFGTKSFIDVSAIDFGKLTRGIIAGAIAGLCIMYCLSHEMMNKTAVEPTIWNLGVTELSEPNWTWYLLAIVGLVAGCISISGFAALNKGKTIK